MSRNKFNPIQNNLVAGDHIVVSRGIYTHHGIYIGGNKVIHYAGLANGFSKDIVRITSLEKFAKASEIKQYDSVQYLKKASFSKAEIVVRAYSKLGENKYNIIFNNCECFANWCTNDDAVSLQSLYKPQKITRLHLRLKNMFK